MIGAVSGLICSLAVTWIFKLPVTPPSSIKHLFFRSGVFASIEEVVFRLIIQDLIGIWITALLWTLLHGFKFQPYGVVVLLIGGYMGYLMEFCGLINAILFHWIFSFVIYLDSRT